jgi:hypothetical protein
MRDSIKIAKPLNEVPKFCKPNLHQYGSSCLRLLRASVTAIKFSIEYERAIRSSFLHGFPKKSSLPAISEL